MRTLLILCLFFLSPAWASQVDTAMWRLDFIHGGGKGVAETFKIEQLILEPELWSGVKLDKLERGDYKVALFASGSDTPWYSQSYSSMYSDWARGVEAKQKQRSFHESVRFPAPDFVSTLVIYRRDLTLPEQSFVPVWQTQIRPDAKVKTIQPELDFVVQELQINGSPEQKLDLLFIAEGFTKDEKDKFFRGAVQATEALFSTQPYAELRQAFNVRAMYVQSVESGLGGDTAFKVDPNAMGMARYALTMENRRLRNMAMQVPYDNIVILTNSDRYSASGIYGAYTVVPAFEPRMRFLLVHELGHHLAGLADEYFHDTPGYAEAVTVVEPHEPNVTALLHAKALKWARFVKTSTPIPTPWPRERYMQTLSTDQSWLNALSSGAEVGAFQGANYSSVSYYRPALNCLMFRDGGDNKFCPVCHHAIAEVITAASLP